MRIDPAIQSQALNISSISDVLSKLNVGDVVRAQLIEIMTNEAMLKLFDGTVFRADTTNELNSKKGEFANFIVTNKVDGKVFLEQAKQITAKSDSNVDNLQNTLKSIGVPQTEKNISVAEKMLSSNLPMSKEAFDNVLQMIDKFSNQPIAKAIFMVANSLEANKNNVNALNQLIDAKANVSTELKQLINLIDNIDFPENSVDSAQNLIKTELSAEYDTALRGLQVDSGANILKSSSIKENIIDLISKNLKETPQKFINEVSVLMESLQSKQTPGDKLRILDIVKNLFVFAKDLDNKQQIVQGKDNVLKQVSKEMNEIFVKIDRNSDEQGLDFKETYKQLLQKLEVLKGNIGFSSVNNDNIINKMDNLQNHIRFINDINSNNTYIQIPVKMFESTNNCELYVLKKEGKKKRIDPDKATFLLALDTNNIGRVESLVSLDKKNIGINLRLDDQEKVDFIKSKYSELYKRVLEKGYRLVDMKYRVANEAIDILNIEAVVTEEINQNKIKLDIKI